MKSEQARRDKADWLRYDADARRLCVTDRQGNQAYYVQLREVSSGRCDMEASHAGGVIRFDEIRLRSLPKRIMVKRHPELMPVTGMPKPGATSIQFEFVRRH
jgi:hypothetical protein